MKKIASLLMGLVVLAGTTFAQPKMKSKTTQKAGTEQAPAATPLKQDGTPDKRFKANKSNEAPMKKDGTKDMRFKKNKMAVKKAA